MNSSIDQQLVFCIVCRARRLSSYGLYFTVPLLYSTTILSLYCSLSAHSAVLLSALSCVAPCGGRRPPFIQCGDRRKTRSSPHEPIANHHKPEDGCTAEPPLLQPQTHEFPRDDTIALDVSSGGHAMTLLFSAWSIAHSAPRVSSGGMVTGRG